MFTRNLIAIAAVVLASQLSFGATYSIDKDHSSMNFTVRHLVSKVKGNFKDFSGKINMDEKKPAQDSVELDIKTASINTGVDKRDDHLRSPDFFDAAKFTDITFKSTKVKKVGKDKYKVEGTLDMHGVKKPITLDVDYGGIAKDPWGNMRAGFSATGKINRKDFGLNWNKAIETGGMMVGDDVTLNLEVEATQDKAAAEAGDVKSAEEKK